MADLFDRLFPTGEGANIPIHEFVAALTDYAAGETTKTQIINYYGLDTDAQTDLTALTDAIDALTGKTNKVAFILELDAVMLMAAHGAKYTTKSAFKTRMGL